MWFSVHITTHAAFDEKFFVSSVFFSFRSEWGFWSFSFDFYIIIYNVSVCVCVCVEWEMKNSSGHFGFSFVSLEFSIESNQHRLWVCKNNGNMLCMCRLLNIKIDILWGWQVCWWIWCGIWNCFGYLSYIRSIYSEPIHTIYFVFVGSPPKSPKTHLKLG